MTSHGMRGEYGKTYHDKIPEIRAYKSRCNDQDIKSILIAQMNSQGEGSIAGGADYKWNFNATTFNPEAAATSGKVMQMPMGPVSSGIIPGLSNLKFGISDKYLYFDSLNSTSSQLNQGEITFSIPAINNNFPLENIIEMEIGSFYFPDVPTGTENPSAYFYSRVTMLMKEISTVQTIQGNNNFRFHFEFDVTPAGISKLLTPVNRKYIFTKPVNSIQQLTFQFRNPFYPINIPASTAILPIIATSAPAAFTLTGTTAPTQPSTQYAIQILTWIPNSPTNPGTTTTLIERTGGKMGQVDAGNTTLTLDDAGTSFVAPETTTSANVLFMQNRFAFVVRFRVLVDEITQYITPV